MKSYWVRDNTSQTEILPVSRKEEMRSRVRVPDRDHAGSRRPTAKVPERALML